MVAEGRAGLAAIDCVTFGLLGRLGPELVAPVVAVVAESPPAPGLPFIASASLPETMLAAVRESVFEALADPDIAPSRAALGLKGARVLAAADCLRVFVTGTAAPPRLWRSAERGSHFDLLMRGALIHASGQA